jgi:hypothetical protein
MEVRKVKDLKNWGSNPRSITAKGFDRLKNQIKRLGKYKPLLIIADGTVIGGNMRLRALEEMGVDEVKVSVIEFHKQTDGQWYATIDGVREGDGLFKSMEDGMMEYSLSDNDRAGFYDDDLLANTMPQFGIDWNAYSVDMYEPLPVLDLLNKQQKNNAQQANQTNTKASFKCPNCGYEA